LPPTTHLLPCAQVLTITGLRYYLFKAVPAHLKLAVSVGIGLYLTFVGFKNGNMNQVTYIGPYGPGEGSLTSPVVIP
jgi:adenine/guanine/hypoxanthine permease